MKFRMNQKVKILSSKKLDGRYNYGKIVGMEKCQNGCYMGYKNEKEFLARYTIEKFKVVYIDCATNRACEEWFYANQLDTK